MLPRIIIPIKFKALPSNSVTLYVVLLCKLNKLYDLVETKWELFGLKPTKAKALKQYARQKEKAAHH